MTIEAVSFDLGASASVRLQLVSSDGLAPLPMPFDGKGDKFSQLLDRGVGGRSQDVSRGLAALSWTIENLRREPSDATKVSCLTHESPVPVVVDSSATPVVNSAVTTVVDSAATPKETRRLAASETVVAPKESPIPVVAEKVVPNKETPLPVAAEPRIATPVVDRQIVETVVAERREPADAPQVSRPMPESPVPVVAEKVVPSKETPLPVAAESRIASPVVDRPVVETVVVERRESVDASQVSRLAPKESPVLSAVDSAATPKETRRPAASETVVAPKESPIPVVIDSATTPMETRRPAASEIVVTPQIDEAAGRRFPQSAAAPAMDTPAVVAPAIDTSVKVATVVEAPAAVAPRVDLPVADKAVVETVVVERREPADASQVSRLAPKESPVLSAVDSAATPKETRRPAASETVVAPKESPIPVVVDSAATPKETRRLAASEAVVTLQVEEAAGRRFPQSVVAPAMDTPAVVAPAIDTSVKVATVVEAPAAVAPRVDLPVVDRQIVETVVVERRESADASQVSRLAPKESPVLSAVDSAVIPMETRRPAASEAVVTLQVDEAAGRRFPQSAVAPAIDTPAAVAPESPVLSAVDSDVTPKETRRPAATETVVTLQVDEAAGRRFPQSVVAPAMDTPAAVAPTIDSSVKVAPARDTPAAAAPAIDTPVKVATVVEAPSAVAPRVDSPVVGKPVVETVVVERRESVDASQVSRLAPKESPVLSAVDSSVAPKETRRLAASETVEPLQADEAAGRRFPQSAAAPAIDTSTATAPVVETTTAPVVEKPTAPIVEKPAAPVVEKTAAPVVEKPTAPVVEKPAVKANEKADNIPSVIEAPAVAAPVAAVPVDAAPQVAAAQSARTEAVAEAVGKVVEIVNEVVEAIVDKIAVTPALAQGEGEIRITLKPTVLDGSEIMLSAKSGELTVHIAPATAEAAQVVQQNLPRLEVALAGHASSFHHVAVVMASAKKGKTDETA